MADRMTNNYRNASRTTPASLFYGPSTVPLLYCVICLLTIITVLLLIQLFKKYCKKCKETTSDSNIEGGTFRMSDLKCNSELENPDDDIVDHSGNLITYTACSDDSSSTSSDSSSPSCGDKQNDNNQQYLTLKTPLQSADYENVLGGQSASALDYDKKKMKKNRDYVNIQEQRNMALPKGRKSKTEKRPGDQDESQTSSESSSDESDDDDDSINYSTVVFKETPKTVQREQ